MIPRGTKKKPPLIIKMIAQLGEGCQWPVFADEPPEVRYFSADKLWRAGYPWWPFRSGGAGGPKGLGRTRKEAIKGYKNAVAMARRHEFAPFHEWHGDKLVDTEGGYIPDYMKEDTREVKG